MHLRWTNAWENSDSFLRTETEVTRWKQKANSQIMILLITKACAAELVSLQSELGIMVSDHDKPFCLAEGASQPHRIRAEGSGQHRVWFRFQKCYRLLPIECAIIQLWRPVLFPAHKEWATAIKLKTP